jgi:DnaK suppressor protein
VTAVPVAQISRVKVQRPHAFTIEDVEEFLRTRGSKESTVSTKKASQPKPSDHHHGRLPPQKKQTHSAASLADILGFNPKEKVNAEERALADIPKKFHKHYKDLQKLRTQVKESLEFHTEETLNRSAKEDSGDLSGYGQHQADAGTDNYDRDFTLSLVSDEQELLFEIEEAIKRIHQGTYGICEVTGKPIAKERLNAVPFARYSLEGQIEYEKIQRRHTQRRGIFDSALDETSSFGVEDDGED